MSNMFNYSQTQSPPAHSAESISLVIAGVAAAIVSIVYAMKNVKHSSCCSKCIECDQGTEIPPSKASPSNIAEVSAV